MSSAELVVPDPRTETVPVGWWQEVVAPCVEACQTWDDLDTLEFKIATVANYIRALGGTALYEYECALRLIEKRRGELLGSAQQGKRTDLQPLPRVEEVDIAPATASRYRKIAEHWDDVIAPGLEAATEPKQVTQTQVLNWVREHTPAKPDADLPDAEGERWSVLHGDFVERLGELEPGSVDLILTDPPYPKEDLPLWSDLAKLAERLLAPRGLLIAYTGQIFLPEVLNRLAEHLNYGWTFALLLPGSGSRIMGRHMVQAWKPVVAFSPGPWPSGEWADDVLTSPDRDKTEYAWQQNAAPAQRLIERFTAPDGLVVDPFLGVGSFGRAAVDAGRRFVGCELDAGRCEKARLLIAANDT